jgi:hypothetical protein
VLALTIAAGITTGLSGCSIFGGIVNQQQSTNLANQRKAAITFIDAHPEVEAITFTRDGSVSGSGTWAANAVVFVGKLRYEAILGIGIGSTSWEPWPSQSPAPSPAPVTLTYSDGTSEILK